MEKGLRLIGYTVMKIFNILAGVPLALAMTVVVLSICLVDLILLLLPFFLICDIIFKQIFVIVVPNNLGLQFVATVLGTAIGYYLKKVLKTYVPKWFKAVEAYVKESFIFRY